MTKEQQDMINMLKELDKGAKKGPWYPQGKKSKDGVAVYRIKPPEEKLLIALRNNIGELIAMIEGKQNV